MQTSASAQAAAADDPPKRYFDKACMHGAAFVDGDTLKSQDYTCTHCFRVVICGAGIIGSAIAYYLAIKGVAATVVERASVACASSGPPFLH